MSEIRPMRRSATVLPRTYAWVIQIACSASAPRLEATCGRPTITIRESIPAIRTPTVVTVKTVHLYSIRPGQGRLGPAAVLAPQGGPGPETTLTRAVAGWFGLGSAL